jgi:endonuclease/exonuclease/phosphatase (EEP) superfamily protein YafD
MLSNLITFFVAIPVAMLAILSATGFLSQFDNICEITSHFRVGYACGALLFGVIALLCRRFRLFLTAFVVAVVNLSVIVPYYLPASQRAVTPDSPHLKILQMNLWGGLNTNHQLVLASISSRKPDVVVFSEITGSWEQFLNTALKEYPYRKVEPRYGGIGIYSSIPLTDTQVKYFGARLRPRIVTKLKIKDSEMVLIAVHTLIPAPRYFAARNGELEAVAKDASGCTLPVIVAGDLNCTPFSYYFQKLLVDGNLHDAAVGQGLQLSWHAPFIPIIPIDHFLVSQRVVVEKLSTGQYDGSDHLPVFIKCAISDPARVVDPDSSKAPE